jgi:hypothetical protein
MKNSRIRGTERKEKMKEQGRKIIKGGEGSIVAPFIVCCCSIVFIPEYTCLFTPFQGSQLWYF